MVLHRTKLKHMENQSLTLINRKGIKITKRNQTVYKSNEINT